MEAVYYTSVADKWLSSIQHKLPGGEVPAVPALMPR